MDKTRDTQFGIKSFFDTNIFIYAFEMHDALAQKILEDAISEDSAMTSVISISEVYTGYYRSKRPAQALIFRRFLEDNYIGISPINLETAEFAGELRGRIKGLQTPDALQLASAKVNSCERYYTNDKKLKNANIEGLEIIVLDDIKTK